MPLSEDLIFLVLQFCNEENLNRTAHMLEQETGCFFNLKYFEELVLDGKWEEAENYLSSFTELEDNKHSTKIYFEMRKQKFLEVIDKNERVVALDILLKDLKVFEKSNKELYKEMTQLLALDNFRQNSSLSSYGDTLAARKIMMNELTTVIEAHPLLKEIIKLPQMNDSRLRRLINQSLNWQHIQCANPSEQPYVDSLFTDHICPGPDSVLEQLKRESLLDHFQLSKSMTDTFPCFGLSSSTLIKPNDSISSPENRPTDSSKEVLKEFPRTVERTLDIVSSPTSMDFHPVHQNLLLVGDSSGDIEIWDVNVPNQLCKGSFYVWNDKSASGALWKKQKQKQITDISVNRVLWSPSDSVFGVAYSKGLIHLYWYVIEGNYSEKELEIDAHTDSVNDLAFAKPQDKLLVISCGDDKLIQVWDTETGTKQYTFEGHEAPVYSICPHVKENVHFLFSISTSGEIRVWLFDNMGSRVAYDAPGFCSMRMAYSSDGKRLFSCGTNKQGESHIVEWNESEGIVVRSYNGLSKHSPATVRFDTSNQFLAVGDHHSIKIWDMDDADILAVIDADGGLTASPCVCFNKDGALLAVSANNNEIKILATDQGRELLKTSPIVYDEFSLADSFRKLAVNHILSPLEPGVAEGNVISDESIALESYITKGPAESYKLEIPNASKFFEVSRCQSVLLYSDVKTNLIRRLVYTNAGNGILALAEDGLHIMWKWVKDDANLSGEATTKLHAPQLWCPKSESFMINCVPADHSSDIITPCFSLSRNDSYLVSASGKMITLYNVLAFKKMRTVLPSPPVATCILFYPPDNNIIFMGMDDSSILVYNIREDKMICKLEGHSKRISGLAFSTSLNLLVSSGVDTQIILWDSVMWEKKKSAILQISIGWLGSDMSETTVELTKDHNHFLAAHETQLAMYETTTLQRVKQWAIANFCTRISDAKFSCNSEMVYAAMKDGILLILGASDLTPRFELNPSAYLPLRLNSNVYPIVVASHPKKPNQFALGLSNGGVVVLEPMESEGKWTALPANNKSSSRL